jgi:hypothetical protein
MAPTLLSFQPKNDLKMLSDRGTHARTQANHASRTRPKKPKGHHRVKTRSFCSVLGAFSHCCISSSLVLDDNAVDLSNTVDEASSSSSDAPLCDDRLQS